MSIDSGIAETHRHDRDQAIVIKLLALQSQPIAQTVTRTIVPGNACRMHLAARRLPHDQQPRLTMRAQSRPRPVLQMQRAMIAAANAGEEIGKSFRFLTYMQFVRMAHSYEIMALMLDTTK